MAKTASKKAAKASSKKTSSDKKRKSKRVETYSSYVYKVLKQVHPETRISKKGIAINAIAPGFIETRLTAAIPVATREVARRLCNLSQGGLPKDIAETVTFLSSPGAAALCGQVVRVCGGSLVGR